MTETHEERRRRLVDEIADDVAALVEPREHVQPYQMQIPGTRKVKNYAHRTQQPSLLEALRQGGAPVASSDGTGSGNGFESRPPNAFACFDRYLAIEAGSAWWLHIGLRRPLRDTVEDNLRALVGAATDPNTRDVDLGDLAADVARFHRWASVLAGWEQPPWAPHAPCPVCEKRGSLRIQLDEREGFCLQCGSTWDRSTIGVLADHIRSEGERIEGEDGDTPDDQGVA